MPTAFVTGANGHVGAHLVRALLDAGYDVVAFVRESSDLSGIDGLELTLRYGDVLDVESLVRGAEGCDVIFHTAAVFRVWANSPEEVMAPAVEGTRNIFAAAKETGASKIVYTSSIVAVGSTSSREELLNEESWNEDASNVYYRAKTESERLAHRLSEETGVPLVVVCPAGILGAWDYRVTPSTAVVRDWINGTATTWKGGMNFVAASDVAAVHLLAAEKGRPGARYLACGENFFVPEVRPILKRLAGRQPRHLALPYALAWFFALLMEIIARIGGRAPLISRSMLREAYGRYQSYDDSRTRQELGHQPRGLEDTLRETISWLLHTGELKPRIAASLAERYAADPAWLPPRGEPPALPERS